MPWKMWPEANLKHFRHQKMIFCGPRKSISDPKRTISERYELNLAKFSSKLSEIGFFGTQIDFPEP